jgi:hypothetical protein
LRSIRVIRVPYEPRITHFELSEHSGVKKHETRNSKPGTYICTNIR